MWNFWQFRFSMWNLDLISCVQRMLLIPLTYVPAVNENIKSFPQSHTFLVLPRYFHIYMLQICCMWERFHISLDRSGSGYDDMIKPLHLVFYYNKILSWATIKTNPKSFVTWVDPDHPLHPPISSGTALFAN